MNVLLDTDTVIEVLRANPKAIQRLASVPTGTDICVSAITAAELYHGAARSRDPVRSVQQVSALMQGLNVISVDVPIAMKFGELKSALQATGQTVADFDLLIAATALVHGMQLVTHNTRHFGRITGLSLDDWLI